MVRSTGGRSAVKVNMISMVSARDKLRFMLTRGKLWLFPLPPYSPELDPYEQVWNCIQHHGVARAALRGAHELR